MPEAYRRQTDIYRARDRESPPADLSHLPTYIAAGDVGTADRVARDQQLVKKPVHGRAYDETYREMDLAPEEGYEPVLLFSPEEQRLRMLMGGYGWRLFFYFKTADGHYGKGYFEEMGGGWPPSAKVAKKVPRIWMHVVFYVNPTPGDRRLDDGRAGWGKRDPDRPTTRPTTRMTTRTAAPESLGGGGGVAR